MILPPWTYFAGGAAALAIAFTGGWTVQSWRCNAKVAAITQQLQEARDKAQKGIEEASATYEADRAAQVVVARDTITQVRTIFRDIPAPSPDCTPPDNAVRLLDRALAGASDDPG